MIAEPCSPALAGGGRRALLRFKAGPQRPKGPGSFQRAEQSAGKILRGVVAGLYPPFLGIIFGLLPNAPASIAPILA